MNTKPDHEWLMLWLEDELPEPHGSQVEAWVQNQEEWLRKREESRRWRAQMTRLREVDHEVPYGEFFQQRLMRALQQQSASVAVSSVAPTKQRWLRVPASVAAALIVGFFAGALWYQQSPRAKVLLTYTPAEGVKADFYESSPTNGTVIVLNGVEALPDELGEPESTTTDPTDAKSKRDAVTP